MSQNISDYIQEHILLPRFADKQIIVLYDPDRRYQAVAQSLSSEKIKVINASESSIEGREEALKGMNDLSKADSDIEGLVVYVQAKAPVTDDEKQNDPFALYIACGNVFPDGAGDEYQNICLRAKPDHATEIRRIFQENPDPPFEVVDAVGGETGWPLLQTLLRVKSATDILYSLLVPDEEQIQELSANDGWVAEAKKLFLDCLGLKLVTKGKTWSTIADELWRFLLFSEFVFDLPEELPESLVSVPVAKSEAQPLITGLCERLRNDRRVQSIYIDRAEGIEEDLDLKNQCSSITNLGIRDTFAFEERSFLKNGIDALVKDDIDTVRTIIKKHADSVWVGKGESQAQWDLVRSAVRLYEFCDDIERELPENIKSIESLIEFYVNRLRKLDRLGREFEQAVASYVDIESIMDDLVATARNEYQKVIGKAHDVFIHHFQKNSWPPVGMAANTDVFGTYVAPKLLEKGRKVAYILVDALRYELGIALKQQLSGDDEVELFTACAQLPTVTKVGMAGLLPDAGNKLQMNKGKDGELTIQLGDAGVNDVRQRMDFLKKQYGDLFAEMLLKDFIKPKKKLKDSVEFLVLRSVTIDSHLENDAEDALHYIQEALRRIRAAVHKLKGAGFQDVIIATDHGFHLTPENEPGGPCSKPSGNWLSLHDRLLLGDGTEDAANFVVNAQNVGIRGDFNQVAGPKSLGTYRAGVNYFHGGVSLQECILPVIAIRLKGEETQSGNFKIALSYKNGAKKITTRLPVITISEEYPATLFQQALPDVELLLEAHDSKGEVVGEAKPGEVVNPATGSISIQRGGKVQVILKMQLEFEGKFTVKAINPTTLAVYDSLTLTTDYTV